MTDENVQSLIVKGKKSQLLIRRKGFVYADANLGSVVFSTGANTVEVDGYGDHFCEVTYSDFVFTQANAIEGVAVPGTAEALLAAATYAAPYYDDRDGADKNVKQANMLGYDAATNNAFATDFPFKSVIGEGVVIWNP